MNEVQREIPVGTPMRDAWERYKATVDYVHTKRWAGYAEHVDGSLWAAFIKGRDRSESFGPTTSLERLELCGESV